MTYTYIYRAKRGLRASDIRPRPDPRDTFGCPWAPIGPKCCFLESIAQHKSKQGLCVDSAAPLRPPSVSPPSTNYSRTHPLWGIYRCPEVRQVSMDSKKPAPSLTQYSTKWPPKGQQSSNPDDPCGDHMAPRAAKCHPKCHSNISANLADPNMPGIAAQVYGRFTRHAAARRVLCEMHDFFSTLALQIACLLAAL